MCYTPLTTWDVEGTDQFDRWYGGLDREETRAVNAAVDFLANSGPGLGRPFVDTIDGSQVANLKELRPKRNGCMTTSCRN
jgi:hypothetical protein